MAHPLTTIKGIGPKTEALFLKLGIHSQEELLRSYPRDYDLYAEPCSPDAVRVGEKNAVLARVRSKPSIRRFGKQSITILLLEEGGSRLQVNWFHMPYLRNQLRVGADYVFRGVVLEKNGRHILQHPAIFSPEQYRAQSGRMLPIYSVTAGLSNALFRRTVEQVLLDPPPWEETLPEQVRNTYALCGIEEAIRQMHYPNDPESFARARRRLVFEELFTFQLGVAQMRAARQSEPNRTPMPCTEICAQLLDALPYRLTKAQDNAWQEISRDLSGSTMMHRMVQGDVGSGKTILAFLAMLQAVENGYQSVLMAPTEVLAAQHAASLRALLQAASLEIPVSLLTGSLRAKERREEDARIASGEMRLIIGTHAVFQEAVHYPELGLVITDEQHRFGVRQRFALQQKGSAPHVLIMSATPIPRTLAQILYGDLDLSLLQEKPADRLPVRNAVIPVSSRPTAWRFLKKEIDAGHQAFAICPMIEPNEELSCMDVLQYRDMLAQAMGDAVTISILHGRMTAEEKDNVMQSFADGTTKILVSTTVVEVGIDIPNATVMLIENAERFGLAQLHQLRGRVGRGDAQSYCIFVQGDAREETSERLAVIGRTNDGFEIAEEDLKLRGPGDLLGTRQSGLPWFALADLFRDADLLQEADRCAAEILEKDPTLSLPEHAPLQILLEKLASSQKKEYDV